jgi:hypothetical protein
LKICGDIRSSRDSATRFSTSGFFHELVSPKPLSIPLGAISIFSDIVAQGVPPVSTTAVANRKKTSIRKVLIILFGYLWVEDKFFSSSSAGAVDIGDNLPSVLLTSAASLPPVASTPVANLPPVLTTSAVSWQNLPLINAFIMEMATEVYIDEFGPAKIRPGICPIASFFYWPLLKGLSHEIDFNNVDEN